MERFSFEQKLAKSWPPALWRDVTVIISVSGGADSVALLRSLAAPRAAGQGGLIVAHFNHKLRAEDSDADEAFVAQLCQDLSLPCEFGRAASSCCDHGGDGLESAARNARYEFLKQIARKTGARFVATGHTADDQAETILHHIVRGTGIAGLAGIPRTRILTPGVTLVRPLLEFRRAEVLEYLGQLQQPHCTDASNQDDRFTRNRIRHKLLPLLASEFNEQVVESLVRLGGLAHDARSVIDSLAEDLLEARWATGEDGSIVVECDGLDRRPEYLVSELMKALWRRCGWPQQAMTHRHWCELAELAMGRLASSTLTLPGAIHVTLSGGRLRFDAGTKQGNISV